MIIFYFFSYRISPIGGRSKKVNDSFINGLIESTVQENNWSKISSNMASISKMAYVHETRICLCLQKSLLFHWVLPRHGREMSWRVIVPFLFKNFHEFPCSRSFAVFPHLFPALLLWSSVAFLAWPVPLLKLFLQTHGNPLQITYQNRCVFYFSFKMTSVSNFFFNW